MVKNKNSPNQLAKKRVSSHDRIDSFINKKEEEKLEKGMVAREEAMQKAGMNKQADNFADHAKIYNYADEREHLRTRASYNVVTMSYNIATS